MAGISNIRDSYTGLNYADQRYYASSYGRFNTPDPYQSGSGSGIPADPDTWNKYTYVSGDPVNLRDLNGTCAEDTDTSVNVCDTPDETDADVAVGPRQVQTAIPAVTAPGGQGSASCFLGLARARCAEHCQELERYPTV
jgi:RHS repeat-associated protein